MINFVVQGTKLHFDEEHLSVDEARQIKKHAGLTVRGFLNGLKEYDVDALVALVWLAKHRTGDPTPWDAIAFDLLGDLEIIPDENDEDADAGPPPQRETSTLTIPPSTPSTPTSTGRTGSARSRSTSATPQPTSTR
jgi:hypothetical protein